MNWDDAKLFLAVARAGQLLSASNVLGVSQSTLSRRMTALETALGTKLIIRRKHGCDLTEAGSEFFSSVERMEAEMIGAESKLAKRDAPLRGTVRIGTPDGFGTMFLSSRLGPMANRHPGLLMQLVPASHNFALANREADIAVIVGRPKQPGLMAIKLTDYSLNLYASPAYLEEWGRPDSVQDLGNHRLVGYTDDLATGSSLEYASEFYKDWQSNVQIASAIGQYEAVRQGVGIGILHNFIAANDATLVKILKDKSVHRSYWLTYHESLRSIPRIVETVNFLKELVKSEQNAFVPS